MLAELNDALRKASDIGYQSVSSGSGTFAPLVPQSIERTLASATHSEEELVFWKNIPKGRATQPVHEFARIKEYGLDLDPFISEGAGGVTNHSTFDKDFVRIRYLAERREPTDVATMVGILGMTPQVLARETQDGTINLLTKLERALFHAKPVTDSHFEGVIHQITTNAPNNVTDLRGKTVTPRLLQNILGELYAAPRYGRPDCIYVEPRVHASLINYAVQFGRHDQLSIGPNGVISYGAQGLQVAAPYGQVPIKGAPFLFNSFEAPAAPSSSSAPAAPVLAAQAPNAAPVNGSLFTADDAGDYRYKVVAVSLADNNGGFSAPVSSNAMAAPAGGSVSLTITAAAGVDYYRIYRSAKNGGADTCKHIDDIAAAGGNDVVWEDKNENIPGTSPVLFVRHDPRIMEFVRLLDLIRRPLAEVKTTKPFLLMMFGSPVVKVPSKCWVLKNAGSPASLALVG